MSAPARTRPVRTRPAPPPRRPVDPRVRDRWVAARREEGRRRLRLVIIVLSVVGVIALAWGVTMSPLLAIEQIQVKGNAQTTPEAVIAAAQVGEGDTMVWLDPGQVVARLESSPWIRTASVTRDWPRTLIIEVTERTPAAWVQVDGAPGVLVVDRTGRVLERADVPPAGLPRLVDVRVAPEPGGTIVPAQGAAIAAAYGLFAPGVAQISVTDGGAVVTLVNGPEVRLGQPTQIRTKLRAAGAVLVSLQGHLPAYIDVSVPTNPVAG